MTRISPAQMAEFRKQQDAALARHVVEDLRTNHPRTLLDMTPETAEARARTGIGRGRARGLTRKDTLALFAELMFLVAPNFDRYPPVRAILEDASGTPDERMDRVVERITNAQWESARMRSDPQAWGAE